jgi:tetratricopeptide (TPR) repeat protein
MDYRAGIEHFRKVVENWPDYQFAWRAQFNIARYYEMIKRRDKIKDQQYDLKIIDAYKTGIEKFPDCEAVDFGTLKIATGYYGIGKFEEAVIYLQKYLEKNPDNLKNIILIYGDCLEKAGYKEEARIIYEDYLKIADTYDKAIPVIKGRLAKLKEGVQ